VPPAVPATATVPPATGPTVSIQVDDDLIDPGQSVHVTVIARHTAPLSLIAWEADYGDESPDGDHSPATDPELAARNFNCEEQTDCAYVWTIAPTSPGRYTLWARTVDTSGVYSPLASTRLRIRDVPTATLTPIPTNTPTPVPTATPTPVPPPPTGSPTP
jgi:hypothetical protein